MKTIKIYWKKSWKWGSMALSLAILGIGFYVYKWEYRDHVLEVYFFSLNKGRSIFIRAPENKTILVGGGQNSEVIREITKVTSFYSRKIDTVITPSATPAQIGGLIEIIDRYNVGEIIMPKIMSTSTVLNELNKVIRKNKIHIVEVEKGDEINLEANLKIHILFPHKDFKFNKSSLPELGMSISYGSTTAYLIGNLSKTIQKDILKNTLINKDENIVEFYNSAIESKVSAELIDAIKPKFIFSTKEKMMHIISDGISWQKK